jgi:hypothetical protein
LIALLCLGAGLTALIYSDFVHVEVQYVDPDGSIAARSVGLLGNNSAEGAGEHALRLELERLLRQIMFYQDKDTEDACQALQRIIRLMDEHPDLLDPVSTLGFQLRENYLAILGEKPNLEDFIQELHALINSCRRKLDEYDDLGIQNFPLDRDLDLDVQDRVKAEAENPSAAEMTDVESRKYVFQQLYKAYYQLIKLYVPDNSPTKDDVKADEIIESLLSVLEAEFGPSYERLPTKARGAEVDKVRLFNFLNQLTGRFEDNTSPCYCPELGLKCLRPITEMLPSLESDLGYSPCWRIYFLQSIATLVLDLACESAPERLLTTSEDRQHLGEAKRVQQRVLELADAVDPEKRDKMCDNSCALGLITMAKIAWRYGDDKTGDAEHTKASKLANSTKDHLLMEVVRRIDKHPSKTAMKSWEPVSKEENDRLRALNSKDDNGMKEETEDDSQQP